MIKLNYKITLDIDLIFNNIIMRESNNLDNRLNDNLHIYDNMVHIEGTLSTGNDILIN